MEESKFAPGFYSLKEEGRWENIELSGEMPEWLQGNLLRTGPALFEFEHQALNHWYDGMAMLHKFSFAGGRVSYASRYLRSNVYKRNTEAGRVTVSEFATDPCKNIFGQVASFFTAPELTDNGNVSIIRYDDILAATSETPLPIVFDPDTLETLRHFKFEDDLTGQIDIAHPHYEQDGTTYSYLLKYSLQSTYQVYRRRPGRNEREVIAEIKSISPSYMHSFGMTENYLILAAIPKRIVPPEVLFTNISLIDAYHWHPEEKTCFYVIHKETGEVLEREGPPFFFFHFVNSFEQEDGTLAADIVMYPDDAVMSHLYLENLRANKPTEATGYLHRFHIPLQEGEVRMERMLDELIELPRIHYEKYNARPYRYAYGTGTSRPGNFLDNITKADLEEHRASIWREEHCYPGEPVFVPRPGGKEEDDGLLLSVVLDAEAGRSFLLLLDARDLREVGRAWAPHIIPFDFHGLFTPEKGKHSGRS